MRGAGCTYNDIVDRDIDAKVARTRSRPIPSGQVSVRQAKVFLDVQALIGLAVLLQFNPFTILVGAASLVAVMIYPFMKRITDWPQVGLGFAFSWGALMGWAALFGSLAWAPVLLYVGCILWTVGYDTIYAHQDKEDDAIVGVRSTARLFGERTKPLLVVFYGAATVLFAASFVAAGVGVVAHAGLVLGALHLSWQIATVRIEDPDSCLRVFRSNRDYGWIIFAGLVADAAIRTLG
jgi:4-hydroxybenzoate polyprenyltransferase